MYFVITKLNMNIFPTLHKIPGIIPHCYMLCCCSIWKIMFMPCIQIPAQPKACSSHPKQMPKHEDSDIKINFLQKRKNDIIWSIPQ